MRARCAPRLIGPEKRATPGEARARACLGWPPWRSATPPPTTGREIWPFFTEVVEAGETYAFDPAMTSERGARAVDRAAAGAHGRRARRRRGRRLRQDGARTGRAAARTSAPPASWSSRPPRARRGPRAGDDVVGWHRDHGYRGIQFNAVVETNTAAVRAVAVARVRDRRHRAGRLRHPTHGLRRPARDVPGPRRVSADAAGTWKLGDLTVNRIGFGAMRLTGTARLRPRRAERPRPGDRACCAARSSSA